MGVLGEMIYAKLFERGPYHRPVIGTEETIRAIGREQMLDYYRKRYSPANVALVVTGDIDPAATIEAAEQAYAGFDRPLVELAPPEPVHALAVTVKERKDDVRLAAALARLIEEDTGLSLQHLSEFGEMRLSGQGEMHLRVALERLSGRYGVSVESAATEVGYRESIRGKASARGRHRKQSGGHGQFGDVVLEVAPLPRGEGVRFVDRITGGVVPRQYISSVEAGVRDFCQRGPLGFPLVDVEVTLTDGSYHTVDSSDMAFRQAARIAMSEACPQAKPVLLEPILAVEIVIPSDAMSRASALVSARRGQIVGYDARPGWRGWDQINAQVPEAEMAGLIVELRSATSGVGSFSARFDHLAELAGKPADAVVAAQAMAQAR